LRSRRLEAGAAIAAASRARHKPFMSQPGPTNSLADIAGLTIGCAEDRAAFTGVTVVVPDTRAVCAVDVRGGGPGTRETDALA